MQCTRCGKEQGFCDPGKHVEYVGKTNGMVVSFGPDKQETRYFNSSLSPVVSELRTNKDGQTVADVLVVNINKQY